MGDFIIADGEFVNGSISLHAGVGIIVNIPETSIRIRGVFSDIHFVSDQDTYDNGIFGASGHGRIAEIHRLNVD